MNELFNFQKNAIMGAISGQPLCEEYKHEWRRCDNDKEKLVKLALRQQSQPFFVTACYQGKGLTKEYLLKEYSYFINGYTVRDADGVEGYTYGLYVDYYYDNALIANQDVLSLMWCEGTNVIVPQTKAPTLYISNKSNVRVSCDGYNNVRVYLFDRSTLSIEDTDENSKVTVYKYSNDAKVQKGRFCLCEVKEFSKELRL